MSSSLISVSGVSGSPASSLFAADCSSVRISLRRSIMRNFTAAPAPPRAITQISTIATIRPVLLPFPDERGAGDDAEYAGGVCAASAV